MDRVSKWGLTRKHHYYFIVGGLIVLFSAFSLHANCGPVRKGPFIDPDADRSAAQYHIPAVTYNSAGSDTVSRTVTVAASSDIIPADRLYDWGTYCGILGGIPNRATVFRTLTPSNTTAEINTAISACPSGQVVYLAAGEYNIGQISFGSKSGVTLRGAGAGQTIINATASPAIASTSRVFYNEDHIDIANGAWITKDSTSITLAASPSAAFSAGNLVMITQEDSPDVWGDGIGVYPRVGLSDPWPLGGTRCLRFVTRITAVNGNAITLASPLPIDFSYSLNPYAMPLRSGPPMSLCGIENLTINGGGTRDRAVDWCGADRCWIKDVEVKNTVGTTGMVLIANSFQCEINRSYFRDTPGYPTESDGFAVMLYYGTSGALVVDNIFHHTGPGVIMNGTACSAIVNNYVETVGGGYATWMNVGIDCNHGPHGVMNLFEGNIFPKFQNDGYHGSTSHGTLFRNNIHGVDPDGKTQERRIVDLCRGSYCHSVVGNVIGSPLWEPTGNEATPGFSHSDGFIYVLGFPNMGNSSLTPETTFVGYDGTYPDAGVTSTLIRHGNYDYYNKGVVWDSKISSRTIPDSLIYSSKPGYFGTLLWPPIGPDVSGLVTNIPAKARWDAYSSSRKVDDLFRSR